MRTSKANRAAVCIVRRAGQGIASVDFVGLLGKKSNEHVSNAIDWDAGNNDQGCD